MNCMVIRKKNRLRMQLNCTRGYFSRKRLETATAEVAIVESNSKAEKAGQNETGLSGLFYVN